MKLSWIIPVYNSGVLLDEAVHSILANMPSKCDCEIFLVNDCSTDLETIRSLNGWKRLPAIKVLNQPENGGPARARNAGLLASTGDWVAFLDADDVVAPGSVEERLMAIAKYSEIRWIVGDMLETREAGKNFHLNSFPKATKEGNELSKNLFKVSQPVAKIALWGMLPFLGAMMIRRDLLAECGPLSEELVYGEDIHFCLVLACFADMYWLNRPVLHLRRYHESMTKNLVRAALEAPRASLVCLKDPRLRSVRKQMRWHYAANLRQSSSVFLQHRMRLRAISYAARSILWSPNDFRSLKALYKSCFS